MKISELENRLNTHTEMAVNYIQEPFDLKREIEKNGLEKDVRNISFIKKFSAVAAVFLLCIIVLTVSPAANHIKGYFKDIIRFDGAIIGTEYANASNDIKINVKDTSLDENIVALNISFENKEEAPFRYIEEIGLAEYKILDLKGNIIESVEQNAESMAKGAVKDGSAEIKIECLEKLNPNEKYLLQINLLYGLSKADAPLEITGNWDIGLRNEF